MRVATKFKNLTREWFNEKGITQYELISSLGATENSHIIGKSDLIVDLSSTGETLRQNNLKIIEDSADTIGYKINGKNTGKLSDIVTNSFYASHIINGAGTGGIVCFNDYKLYQRAKLLRGWGRSSATFNESENINKRFNIKISGIDYDAKYVFSEAGYNFLPSEISAAFALEQLKKLPFILKKRKDLFHKYLEHLKLVNDIEVIQSKDSKNLNSSYYSLSFLLNNLLSKKRFGFIFFDS